MKGARSQSVLKTSRNNNRRLLRDPSFTNRFEGVVLLKDVYAHNLYRRYLGKDNNNHTNSYNRYISNSNSNNNNVNQNSIRKIIKFNPSRNSTREVIISPLIVPQTKSYNNIFNMPLDNNNNNYYNPYRKKYNNYNLGSHHRLPHYPLKKSNDKQIQTSDSNRIYKSLCNKINKYRQHLHLYEPLPNIYPNSIDDMRIYNKYINNQ